MSAALAGVLIVAAAAPANAAGSPGSLDPTFGSGGTVTTDFGGADDFLADITVLPDNSTIAVGSSQDFELAKYRPDGSLDPSFGTAGQTVTDVSGTGGEDHAYAVAAQPDGKLVVTGSVGGGWNRRFAITRYLPSGILDPTFGTGGIVVTALGGARGVALQPDGKIVAVGSVLVTGVGTEFAVARYLPSGILDPTFGSGGTVITWVSGAKTGSLQSLDAATAVLIQPDGKIVVGGRAGWLYGPSLNGYDFGLVRYTPSGALDTTFGTAGKVLTALTPAVVDLRSLALRPDGRIIAVGTAGGAYVDDDIAIVQYRKTGAIDTTFGTVLTDFTGDYGDDTAADAVLRPDGRLLVAGTARHQDTLTGPATFTYVLARYGTSGTLDPTFGTGGRTFANPGSSATSESASAMAVGPTGRAVVGGTVYLPATADDFAIAAFQ